MLHVAVAILNTTLYKYIHTYIFMYECIYVGDVNGDLHGYGYGTDGFWHIDIIISHLETLPLEMCVSIRRTW